MNIRELIDFDHIQEMVEANFRATGIPTGIIDADTGEIYSGVGWQKICIDFHRLNHESNKRCVESDTNVKNNIQGKDYFSYKCANGLWDIGIPIYIDDKYKVTLFLGQFFYEDEVPDRSFFIKQAESFSYDVDEYLTALDSVPVFTREKVQNILEYNMGLAKFIGNLATQNLQLLREMEVRKKAEKELSKARNYINNIFDSMPSVLIGVDSQCRITHLNKTAEKFTGYSSSEALGQSLSAIYPSLKKFMDKIIESIINLTPIKERWVSDKGLFEDMTIYPLCSGEMEGAVIRFDDVTDQVKMEEILVQTEKMMSIGGLAAGMAHEINNPLAGIVQTASVLSNRLDKNLYMKANNDAAIEAGTNLDSIDKFMKSRKILKMIDSINDSGKRISEIIDNMLSFSRDEGARVSTHHIVELIDKTIDLAGTDYNLKKRYDLGANSTRWKLNV